MNLRITIADFFKIENNLQRKISTYCTNTKLKSDDYISIEQEIFQQITHIQEQLKNAPNEFEFFTVTEKIKELLMGYNKLLNKQKIFLENTRLADQKKIQICTVITSKEALLTGIIIPEIEKFRALFTRKNLVRNNLQSQICLHRFVKFQLENSSLPSSPSQEPSVILPAAFKAKFTKWLDKQERQLEKYMKSFDEEIFSENWSLIKQYYDEYEEWRELVNEKLSESSSIPISEGIFPLLPQLDQGTFYVIDPKNVSNVPIPTSTSATSRTTQNPHTSLSTNETASTTSTFTLSNSAVDCSTPSSAGTPFIDSTPALTTPSAANSSRFFSNTPSSPVADNDAKKFSQDLPDQGS